MIGFVVSFCSALMALVSIFVYAKDDTFKMYCSFAVFVFSILCFRVCYCDMYRWYSIRVSLFLMFVWNDILIVLLCGILYGSLDVFFSVCVFICISCVMSCIFEYYKEKQVEQNGVKLPRITYLEIW